MIKNILDNQEVGYVIPVLIADIVKIKARVETEEGSKQNIIVKDKQGTEIRILLKDRGEVTDDMVGKSFSFESISNAKGLIDGLVLKKTKSEEYYISCAKFAKIITIKDAEPVKEVEVENAPTEQEEEQEEEFPADKLIDRLFKERHYIYQRLVKLNEQYDGTYPADKLPELATSIYISIERSNVDVFPKAVKPKRFEKPKEETKKLSDWRSTPHFTPEAKGKKLGEYDDKEIISKFGKMYYRMVDKLHEYEPEKKEFFEAVGQALKEFDYKLSNACADYMLEYNPNLKTQTVALQRLSKFFKSKGLNESTVDQALLKKFLSNAKDVEKAANNDF